MEHHFSLVHGLLFLLGFAVFVAAMWGISTFVIWFSSKFQKYGWLLGFIIFAIIAVILGGYNT